MIPNFERIQSKLTKLYGKGRGGITEVSEYSVQGVTGRVYWFRQENQRLGDYSPFGTILLNEVIKEDYSKDAVDYVFLHETGHDQLGFIPRTVFWSLYFIFGLLFLATAASAVPLLIMAVYSSPSPTMVPVYLIVVLGITGVGIAPFALIRWFDETIAELFAISKLGRSKYQAVIGAMKEDSDSGILYRIWHRLNYPPESLILRLARRWNIGEP